MGFPRPPRATAPSVRDAALEYLEKRQAPADPNAGGGDTNQGGNANNGGNTNQQNGGNNNADGNANGGNANNGANNNQAGNNPQNGGNNNNNNQQNGGNNNNNNQQNGSNNNNNNQNGGAQPTGNGNATVSGGAGGNNTNSSVSIPQTAAAGGITMLQPPQTGSASYFKLAPKETITFKWNMTSLYVQPKTLTVIASCGQNGNTYPVGPTDGNQNVFDGNTTEAAWCPYDWQQVPGQPAFAAASYTLQIWDERGPGVPRKGGWLTPYSGTKFGMYIPQAYTPLADWKCATCSGATRLLGEPAGLSVMVSIIIMFFSAYVVLRR